MNHVLNAASHLESAASSQTAVKSASATGHVAANPADAGVAEAQTTEALESAGPIAVVRGEPYTLLPQDLYIPPDALEIILETFEGPLDLLLYLIKRQNLDILNIPIADITRQYMEYIALMESMRLELAAEYLVMAATLAEIKSRMLLPRVVEDDDDEADPRAELIRRLQEYEQIKDGAAKLDDLPRMEREIFPVKAEAPEIERDRPLPDITLKELLLAFRDVAMRAHANESHHISREALSVRAKMSNILSVLRIGEFLEFTTCLQQAEGRLGVVVNFLAILELCKESSVDIIQSAPFAPIYIKPRFESLEPDDTGEPGESAPDGSGSDEAGDALADQGSAVSGALADQESQQEEPDMLQVGRETGS